VVDVLAIAAFEGNTFFARPVSRVRDRAPVAQVVRVLAIAAFEGNTFFARLHLAAAGGAELELDARPSDAINLAARTGAPLFVRRDVAGRVARHQ
jgi:bifunctional DNase/RNase